MPDATSRPQRNCEAAQNGQPFSCALSRFCSRCSSAPVPISFFVCRAVNNCFGDSLTCVFIIPYIPALVISPIHIISIAMTDSGPVKFFVDNLLNPCEFLHVLLTGLSWITGLLVTAVSRGGVSIRTINKISTRKVDI